MAPEGGQGFARQSFQRLLTEALRDLAATGYVSRGQIEEWLSRLRAAAERELGAEARIDAAMRAVMESAFRRLIDQGKIAEYVPGVSRYTVAMIKPQLRAELDRRILAAADLIKIHRREAIEKTLQRFAGWSTSIPPSGEGVIDKREVRAAVTKSLKQYDFERRRVAIDQGAKLIANVADIVARDGGAIAAEWHSHWRQPGYNYRPDHKERDGKIYAIRDSWAHREGLITKGAGFTDEMTAPAQEPFCRCFMRYITSPRRLPEDMLTRKGREWIGRGADRSVA